MKGLITTLTVLVTGIFLSTAVLADDVDDVKAAVQSKFAALNSGDAAAYVRTTMPEFSAFGPGGGLLEIEHSSEEQRNSFQADRDAGQRLNLQVRHLDVRVYGDAAIVTGYVVGTITTTDGTTIQSRDQRTGLWIKQGGQWREAHRHNSPIALSQ